MGEKSPPHGQKHYIAHEHISQYITLFCPCYSFIVCIPDILPYCTEQNSFDIVLTLMINMHVFNEASLFQSQ